jgi:transposase
LVDTSRLRAEKENTMPTGKRYSSEFKDQVVALVRTGRSFNSVAREFQISDNSVAKWVNQAGVDAGERGVGLTTDEKQELAKLRKRVRQLEVERDILSKAAAWFARETGSIPNGSSNS